jgi:hypothetical protein
MISASVMLSKDSESSFSTLWGDAVIMSLYVAIGMPGPRAMVKQLVNF